MFSPLPQLTAIDPDLGVNSLVSYSLFPKQNDVFGIDPDQGVLTARTKFDHELMKKVNVIVTATDHGQPALVSTATVQVNIMVSSWFSQQFTSFTFLVLFCI